VLSAAACGNKNDSSTASSSSKSSTSSSPSAPPAAAADYSVLLMKASDIPTPAGAFASDPPLLNPSNIHGVAQLFHTADNTAIIGDTLAVMADPTEAANVLAKSKEGLGTSVTGAPQPSPVGANGTVAAGTSPDGSKAVTVLMFTEANVFATLEFDSAPGDLNPVPPDFVETVGKLQLDAITAGLPKLPPAGTPSSGAAPAKVTIDGQSKAIDGPVVCSTTDGKFSIAIGEAVVGVIVGLEPDGSVVHSVGLGDVNGVVLSFTEGAPGNTATATKDGNNYKITGTATGTDNASQQVSKPYEITVTCP
jgi:lipoprotein LpqH